MCWGWTFHFFHCFLCFIQPYYYRIFYCFSVCCGIIYVYYTETITLRSYNFIFNKPIFFHFYDYFFYASPFFNLSRPASEEALQQRFFKCASCAFASERSFDMLRDRKNRQRPLLTFHSTLPLIQRMQGFWVVDMVASTSSATVFDKAQPLAGSVTGKSCRGDGKNRSLCLKIGIANSHAVPLRITYPQRRAQVCSYTKYYDREGSSEVVERKLTCRKSEVESLRLKVGFW